MKRVELFFDVASPYSYMCATQIEAVAGKHGAEVVWRPMLLGAVFKAAGNDMPARVAAKATWMMKDLAMWAALYRVPFAIPPSFPPNSLRAMRACCFAESRGSAGQLAKALFDGYWAHAVDPSSDDGLGRACGAAGLDPVEVLRAAESQPMKDALRKNTEEAVARGAFGAPTIFVGETMFFGNDRLPLLDRLLAGAALGG
jgi:2-hydroxychromene-2-carboxylate isomerase